MRLTTAPAIVAPELRSISSARAACRPRERLPFMTYSTVSTRGLNSAASDIYYLYHAMLAHYQSGDDSGLEGYSAKALARIWKAQRFSWWMTMMLHRFPDRLDYEDRLQQTELEYLFSSETAQRLLAENYVGLPF